ncbi:MAG: ferrous iron transport protein B [Pirellula sp.]|jgi:ferrous iron transport protein B
MKQAPATVALIGNPNTGKSSLFNALCGSKARVGNYPGVTVEHKTGRMIPLANAELKAIAEPNRRPTNVDSSGFPQAQDGDDHFNAELGGREIDIVDLPGTYSLAARSADEAVSVDVLSGNMPGVRRPDAVVVIVDATNIERNLYLFSQVIELGLPTILVLNMWDRVEPTGITVDIPNLARGLGVPIVCTCASKRSGIDLLRLEIHRAVGLLSPTAKAGPATPSSADLKPTIPTPPEVASLGFPDAFRTEVESLGNWLRGAGVAVDPFQVQRLLIDDAAGLSHRVIPPSLTKTFTEQLTAAKTRLSGAGVSGPLFETRARYGWIKKKTSGLITRSATPEKSNSDWIDRWLTHRWFGLIFFVAIMFLVFQSITLVASWPMAWIDEAQNWFGATVEGFLAPGPLRSLLVDGVIAGVGSVIIFLPQIAILFLFIAILEDCGYMSRAAFVMDKFMSSIGMSGKSFLPLMSSFACAIPGIMATRTIDNRKDRMVTLLVAPLMSCSARLPVYVLMVSAFVPDLRYAGGWLSLQGFVLFAMQSLGALVAIPVAWLLKRFFFRGETSTFIMELSSYKWPSWRVIVARVWERVLSFISRAGTLIFITSVLVWAAAYFPMSHATVDKSLTELEALRLAPDSSAESIAQLEDSINRERSRLIEGSFLGVAGHTLEPIVKPLGWDGKIGIAVLASFPAREVIIATLGTIYALGGEATEEHDGLKSQMRAATWPDGSPVFTLATALSIMVFFALCAQCASTLMTIRRETNSWRWPIFSFAYMTTLAYLGAMLTYHLVKLWL